MRVLPSTFPAGYWNVITLPNCYTATPAHILCSPVRLPVAAACFRILSTMFSDRSLWLLNCSTRIYSSHPLPKSNCLKLHNIPYLRWNYALNFIYGYYLLPYFGLYSRLYPMPSILSTFMLQSFIFYPPRCKWNAVFLAFLKPGEINVGFLLYRDSQEILDEAILSNLVQLLPSEFEVPIINFFFRWRLHEATFV